MWPYEKTLGQILQDTVQKFQKNDAITYLDQRISYGELLNKSDALAKGLLAMGVKRGDHVAILAGNTLQALCCFYAVWSIGAVLVPICTGCTEHDLASYLRLSESQFLLFDDGFKQTDFQDLARKQQQVQAEHLVYIGEKRTDFLGVDDLVTLSDQVSQGQLQAAKDAVLPSDYDCILFTAGSTGSSRPVITTHFSRVNNIYAQAAALETTAEDRFCAALPMYHCFALSGTILSALVCGACVCFPNSRRTTEILTTIQQQRCTIISAVPTLFSAMLANEKFSQFDLSSLRTGMIGGSPYPPMLFINICQTLDMTLLPSLGQTEATAGFTTGSLQDTLPVRSQTIGKFFPHIEGEIRDPKTGLLVKQGEVGEICIRGYNVMQGYYQMPEATAAVLNSDGWLHTGDLGAMDREGYLYFQGRLKELIIRGGENIYPLELDNCLSHIPGIAEIKTISVPDPHYIEEVCVCIVRQPGSTVTENDVREYATEHLAYYKVPKYILFLDSIPLKATGKPDVTALQAIAKQKFLHQENKQ